MHKKILTISALLLIQVAALAQWGRAEDYQTVVPDGAWCWFSDPRAVFHKGEFEKTYTGYVNSTGDVMISSTNHSTENQKSTVIYKGFQKDDHVNPSILILPDGRLMVFFTRHNGTLFYTTSLEPESVTAFAKVDSLYMGRGLCYTNPVMLSEEANRIYVFFRGGYDWQPSFITSDDLGKTWSEPKVMVSKKAVEVYDRPYTKVISDGKASIHFAFTDGHPREENLNSIYYMKYQQGKFYDAAGNQVGDMQHLPVDQDIIPKAYDGVAANKRSWIWDIAVNDQGHPVIVYSTLPEETNHFYQYGYWTGDAWKNIQITRAGSAFPRFERVKHKRDPEPHYSGGITLDHQNPKIVYLSSPVKDRFEIEKWELLDQEGLFDGTPVTYKSLKDNVRPVVVRHAPESISPRVLWMQIDHYEHYTKYKTAIKGDKEAKRFSGELTNQAVTEVMAAVASWQIDNFQSVKHHHLDWTNGALYKGMMEWAKIAPDQKYVDWLSGIGWRYGWQPHKRMYHADDVVVNQMYLEMYERKAADKNSYRILGPTKARLDYVMQNPSKGTLLLDYYDAQTLERWSWCDALFMAPPVYVKLAKITGDDAYIDFMHEEFMATYDFLYDNEEHLFYRDHRYFPEKQLEANGEKIFWGRGNGWVMGGLVSILKDLPKDSKYRPFYEKLFVEMAQKVATCQDESGYWHASMLDPESFPRPETSSSGFFCHALAYGINAGLIDKEKYTPQVEKAWKALVNAVFADGKLGWVQPIGENPKNVTEDMTEVYGVGAFLLAGTEVLKMIDQR